MWFHKSSVLASLCGKWVSVLQMIDDCCVSGELMCCGGRFIGRMDLDWSLKKSWKEMMQPMQNVGLVCKNMKT